MQTRRYLLGKFNLIKIQDKSALSSYLQNRTLYLTKNNNVFKPIKKVGELF